MKGWLGVIENQFIDLSKIHIDPRIGGTLLKSSRVKLEMRHEGIKQAKQNLHHLNLEGLIVVGGEDTLSNSFSFPDFPQVLISKTIDNDVGTIPVGKNPLDLSEIINYFTLGFPTAAQKISSFVSLKNGLRTTAYSHERIIVVESMGMHAGWLALSSAMGHPDFIVIPEFPLDYNRFLRVVYERYEKKRNVIIVVAEGARFADKTHISADEKEKDDFGHPRFKGAAEVLSRKLKRDLREHFDTRNVNSVNPSYLYRSGAPSGLDSKWADHLGLEAVRLLLLELNSSAFLTIRKGRRGFSIVTYPILQFKNIEAFHRLVDERFYNPDEYSVTEEGKRYLAEMVEEVFEEDYGLINETTHR
jgi:6-phosphofructokinase 1